MRLLLDTQVALWWLTASPRLSKTSRKLHRLGKLPVSARRFRDEMRAAGSMILSVSNEHAMAKPGRDAALP